MKIFTKSLLTLLLLCVAGVVSAQAPKKLTVLSPNGERDWTKQSSYGYYYDTGWSPNDFTYELAGDDGLHLNNPTSGQFQLFLLDWANQTQGDDYVVRIWLKADGAGSGNLSIGTWTGSTNVGIEWEASDDFVMIEKSYNGGITTTGNDVHILFQSSFVGEIYVQKAQLLGYEEIKPEKSNYGEWVSLINNGDLEGTDNSNFHARIGNVKPAEGELDPNCEIQDGVGVDGSRGLMVSATDKLENPWDNQFFIRTDGNIPEGTKIRLSFDYKADEDAKISAQHHALPGDYIGGNISSAIVDLNCTSDWQHHEGEATISASQAYHQTDNKPDLDRPFQTVTYNLSELATANNYYFDNIVWEKFVPLDDATFNDVAIKILFTENTNLVRLLTTGAPGKTRLIFPNDCVTVKANDEVMPIGSVECDATGALMIFLDEEWVYENEKMLTEDTKVEISLKNPADEKFHIVKLNSDNTEGDALEDKELTGRYDGSLNIKSDSWNKPSLVSADPEDGSFHMDATTNEFTLTFDKEIICNLIVAKLDGKALTVEPATGEAETIKLKYAGAALAEGEHKVTFDKAINAIWGEMAGELTPDEITSGELTFSVGAKEMDAQLAAALTDAKAALYDEEGAMADRYAGDVATALDAAIKQYEVEGVNYTAPSVNDAAVLDVRAKLKAFNTHKSNCDTYDKYVNDAQNIVDTYGDTPFATSPSYVPVKEAVDKYAGNELTDDEALTAAVAELKAAVDPAKKMFTVADDANPSKCYDSGIKVLVERIRSGAATLKNTFNVGEDDELIVAATNAMSDDDHLANLIKQQIKLRIYEELKNPESTLLTPETDIDPTTEEEIEVPVKIDMTVFIKNPNVYAKDGMHKGRSDENVPGWEITAGNPGINNAWRGDANNIDGLAEDVMFTAYHSESRMQQTITDLPAGIYTVVLDAANWDEGNGGQEERGFAFAKTSQTDAVEEGADEDRDLNFAGTADITFHGQYVANYENVIEGIEVLDGELTLGVNFGPGAQYEFDSAKLYLTAPAEGFNYVMAYESYSTAIDAAAAAPKVRAIELYDLNGRRIAKAQKGLAIVKKVMSDGTVKTEKVVK